MSSFCLKVNAVHTEKRTSVLGEVDLSGTTLQKYADAHYNSWLDVWDLRWGVAELALLWAS